MSKAGVFVASQSFLHTIHNWRWSSQRLARLWWTSGDLEPIFTLEPGCCCLLSAQCWQMQRSRWHQHNVPTGQWSHGSHGAPGNIGGHVTWSHWSSGTLGVMRPCQVKSSLVALFCDPVSNPLRHHCSVYTGASQNLSILGSFCTITWINYMMIQNNVLPISFGLMEDFIKWNIGCE